MQSTIGKILLEERQIQGISLKDLAEATKIRMDYLEAIEKDQLSFDLPDIYKRGFIRIYANHLGLDLEDLMALCPIAPYEALDSNEKRREMISTVARKQAAYIAIEPENIPESLENDSSYNKPSEEIEKLTQKRTIITITGILCVVVMVFWIFSRKSSKSAPTTAHPAKIFEKIAPHREILLRAKGSIKVIVRERDSKERLYTGSLLDNEERYIEYEKPIQIYYDKGESLSIELANGEILHPEKGRGGIEIK